MKTSALLLAALAALALPASAANDGAAVYRPGLTQARIPLGSPMGYLTDYLGIPAFASNLLENAEEPWLDRTLGVFKDSAVGENAVNPISGKTWPWILEEQHGVFAYEGELWVEEGTNYYFYGRCSDGAAMVVDGKLAVWQGLVSAYNLAPNIRGFWTAPKTGWVPFNVWFWSYEGHTGRQNSEWGLQYNVAGYSLDVLTGSDTSSGIRQWSYNSKTNVWKRFGDPGNGTFLRTRMRERFTTVGESAATENGRSFDLSFENVPTNAQLVAFFGPVDGFHDTNGWKYASGVLAEVTPETSTTNVTVELPADATVLRFRLAHFDPEATDGLANFEEWTEMMPVTAAPVVRIDAVSPGYTNVVVSGTLGSFGIGGGNATVTVEVAEPDDADFADAVSSAVLPVSFAVGSFGTEIFGLRTNANYLVRAKATNNNGKTGYSATFPFSTRDPDRPSAFLAATVCAYRSATLEATFSDWGGGSSGVEAWIDVSADAAFPAGGTQTLPLGVLSGSLPETASATTADPLNPETDYFARVRATNSWGVASVSEPIGFRTAGVPIEFPEPEATASKGHVSVTLAPTFVADGTDYDVTLEESIEGGGGGIVRRWRNENGTGSFAWEGSAPVGRLVTFTYTIAWRYPSTGATGQLDRVATTAAKIADHVIDGLPAIDPLNGGAYLRPGDTVAIKPTTGARIDWQTNDVFSVTTTNGLFLITALEPGASLFYETTLATGKTNNVTGAAIVLPAENPPGGIYVHRRLPVLPEFAWRWNDPGEWEVVAPGSGDYPNGAGAMVYIVSDALGIEDGQRNVEVTEPVTVGWLAVGQLGWIHHVLSDKSHWPWIFSDNRGVGGSIRFDTGDGSASWLRLLGHSYVTSRVLFEVPVSMANDFDIDELDRVQDTTGWKNTRYRGLWFLKPVDIGDNVLRTVRTHFYPYNYVGSHGSGVEAAGWVSFRNDIRGSGTIRLEAPSLVGLVGADGAHVASFTGLWDVANGDLDPHVNAQYGGAGLNLYGLSLGNAEEMIVRGSWHRAEKTLPRGAVVRTGFQNVRTGYDTGNGHPTLAWTNDWQDALPGRIVLDGGVFQFHPQGPMDSAAKAAANASGIRRNVFRVNEFVVPAGPMGRLESKTSLGNGRPSGYSDKDYAHVRTEITNLLLDAGSVLSFDLDKTTSNVSNEFYIVEKPDAAWSPDDDAQLQFLPFFFANNQREGTTTGGATISAETVTTPDNDLLAFRDRTTGKVSTTNTVDVGGGYKRWTAGETLVAGTNYVSMQLASNVTNSFVEGATVYNLAGYLDMRGGAALGRPGEDAGATLDFGDQPARVYLGIWNETGTIGCKIAGTAGLVKGGNGILALAASAEGVEGGVRVAGGTLRVGATDAAGKLHPGRIAGDVRVEAGSRLVLCDTGAVSPKSKLFLNDRDWIPSVGHVRLEAGAKPVVKDILVAGEPLAHGWYGSSESSAKFVDDVHFEGPGMIHAGSFPTMMILR